MKKIFGVLLAMAAMTVVPAYAAGLKCEDLQEKITAKLEAKKVKGYTLTVVDAKEDKPGRVVGTCELSSKKIIYTKG